MDNTFYLAPSFDEIIPEHLFLMGFYTDTMVVSDGLLWWRFFQEEIPLLSYLSSKDQQKELLLIAEKRPELKQILCHYCDLIECGLVKHVWLAQPSWLLLNKPNDTEIMSALINDFNLRFKGKRQDIATEIHNYFRRCPNCSSSEAISQAREIVAVSTISEMFANPSRKSIPTSYQAKLVSRFREHLRDYVSSEQFANKWSANRGNCEHSYAGDLADIVSDLKSNQALIPIFGGTTISKFVDDWTLQKNIPLNKEARNRYRAFRLGFRTLQSLPKINFNSVEEMVKHKKKLEEELHDFHIQMSRMARLMSHDATIGELEEEVDVRVKEDLLPTIKELSKAVEQCRMTALRESCVALSASALAISASVGTPTATLLALGGAWLASSILRYDEENKRLATDSKYRGLSLTLRLPKRKRT